MWIARGKPGTLLFLSDVKARHGWMVELVERMMTADGLRLRVPEVSVTR